MAFIFCIGGQRTEFPPNRIAIKNGVKVGFARQRPMSLNVCADSSGACFQLLHQKPWLASTIRNPEEISSQYS
jgi:hypothetical protein